MGNMIETILIAVLIVSGLTFFFCLEKSMKAKSKLPKILFLVGGIICAVILMEAILHLTNPKIPIQILQYGMAFLMRVMQGMFIILGILMSVGIAAKKET